MQHPIRFLAVDDDPIELMAVTDLASDYDWLECRGSFTDAQEALAFLEGATIDLVILDIEMPAMSGIDLLSRFRGQIPAAIFVTSHPEFALDGFRLAALDYLLKPVMESRFQQAMLRVQEYFDLKQKAAAFEVMAERESLLIKEGRSHIRLPRQDIIYLEAMQDYTKIMTSGRRYMVNQPLSAFVENFPEGKFLRIHRSYAVPVQRIREIKNDEILGEGFALPVGKTYRSALNKLNRS